jgi:hypothetical protein
MACPVRRPGNSEPSCRRRSVNHDAVIRNGSASSLARRAPSRGRFRAAETERLRVGSASVHYHTLREQIRSVAFRGETARSDSET